MTKGDTRSGQSELRAARRQSRGLFASVFALSVFVNLLMLTGPIFMLQVYDRVLGSRSEATLVALFGLSPSEELEFLRVIAVGPQADKEPLAAEVA